MGSPKRNRQPAPPWVRLTPEFRRRALSMMAARDDATKALRALSDDRICDLWRIAEALCQPDGYGSGSRGGRSAIGSHSDPTGQLAARHAGGRIDAVGAVTDDTWEGSPPHRMLVSVTMIADHVHEAARRIGKAEREWVAIDHLPDHAEASERNWWPDPCRRCRSAITGDVADAVHGGLCEACYGEYQAVPSPRPPIHEWLMRGGPCRRCALPTSGKIGDSLRDGLCLDCHGEYQELSEPRPSVGDFVARGGRCDHCDKLCAGSDSDRLREAGETAERYCMGCYQRWRRIGADSPLMAVVIPLETAEPLVTGGVA